MRRICIYILFFIFCFLPSKALALQIGVWETTFSNSVKIKNVDIQKVSKQNISRLDTKQYPIILFTSFHGLDGAVYDALLSYIKKGGKVILSVPVLSSEDEVFKKLSKVLGVNVNQIVVAPVKAEVNWVERTLSGNLPQNSKIASVSLTGASHLAVFGEIERHESAVSFSKKGAVINWCWGSSGSNSFNEKTMQYILEEFAQYIETKNSAKLFSEDDSGDIAKLRKTRNYIEKYQNIPTNMACDISDAQQMLELSKYDELQALYYLKNNNQKEYSKYLKLSQDKVSKSICGLKNLSPAENRGIWFDRGTIVTIKNRGEMGKYFEQLKNSGINTVYFETVNAGYTVYPSKIGVQNPLTKGRDPLLWAVEEAHLRNMKLQAWVWVFAVGNDRHNKIINKPEDYPGPVLEKNMRWALLGENGNLRPKNQPEFWIDPSNKEGANYILQVIDEIVKNYNVDGIQLDYIRYPFQSADNIMGFNHNSAEMFSQKTGEKLYENNYQTNTLRDKWKQENINSFVKTVYQKTRRTKPKLKVSASIFTKSPQSRQSTIQQSWETWASGNYIDSLTPMSYSMSVSALSSNLAPLKTQIGTCPIYPGVALQHVDEVGIMEQVMKIREEGYPGVSFFALAQFNQNKSKILENGFYSQNTCDPSYNIQKSAILLLQEYKELIQSIFKTNSDLTQSQKESLSYMLSSSSLAISYASSEKPADALLLITKLQLKTTLFFKDYAKYSTITQQMAISYLKRAENLIKISKR